MSEKKNLLEELKDKRGALIEQIKMQKYSYIEITDKDKKANDLFHSKIEANFKFEEDFYYNLAMKYKKEIESNEFFKDLQNMPKGCLLHNHMASSIDTEWISKEVMKEGILENIYVRKFHSIFDILIYTKKPDVNEPNYDRPFKDIIEKYLNENKDKNAYDYFHSKLSMLPEEIEKLRNNNDAWAIFMPKYFFCFFLILYKEFYKQHIRNIFLQCIYDKQYRIETRLTPGYIKDENYNDISVDEEMAIYQEELKYVNSLDSMKLDTKFTFGIIVEMVRNRTDEMLKETIQNSISLRKKYPDLICGIDLVGNEDNFRTFQDLTSVMLNNTDPNLPWILHCGESIKAKNHNFIDTELIGAKRYGHCINLFKLGNLFEHIKKKQIVLEINPISNQTLRQVRDLRLHPCIGYHNNGMKCCINNDDPTLYNTKGIKYDFFVATATMEFDLLDLKCFCLNSIEGSQISDELKNEYKATFLKSWSEFLNYLIEKYGKSN